MNYYNKIAKGYDRLHKEEQIKKLGIIAKYFVPKETMIDVGAGTCIAARYFSKIKTVSVDPSSRMLAKGIGVRVVAKAESLPFEDHYFSSLISLTAIHHFDIDKSLAEMKHVLKKNSPIVITVLKKAKDFKNISKKILRSFKVKEYDCYNDVAFIGKA